ncbi:MAG: acyltransferase family protein [Candidatus Eisenbacteria bacterium]|uniref:Acyltransferase family protein n=1 Tax=Eiseniibacteriota bacterium TaxID=2212470 RepID=A0A948RX63_UNCEI|nr:acyltransferase family protein [Candidatus Eisenbacteria bacterium]MBU1948275.1 acyltransferase family protein [Candidatus Eisenbacteria bacterium]MBU2689869.1 acyltransferase family protein [Candidatus Eisenbacteria bacterium]
MNRIVYLDRVKALGMLLVFFGHFIEKLYFAQAPGALLQWKAVYAMHMPLFFFLAGVFWKPGRRWFLGTALNKIKTRLIPVILFSLIALPFWFLISTPVIDMSRRAALYISGSPKLNWLCWFLVCLFTLEILLLVYSRFFRGFGRGRIIGLALFCYVIGWGFADYGDKLSFWTGIRKNFWFLNESLTAAGIYLTGFLFRDLLFEAVRPVRDFVILLGAGIIFFATFNLNQGPFEHLYPVAIMAASRHGQPVLFVLTALAGIIFVIWLLKMIPLKAPLADFIGRNTIIYLGLNGLCFHFFDTWIYEWVGYTPGSPWMTFGYTMVYSIVMMMFFIPMAWMLRRFVPELVGLPWSGSSLLPKMKWGQ